MFESFRSLVLATLLVLVVTSPFITDEPEEHIHEEESHPALVVRTPHYPV